MRHRRLSLLVVVTTLAACASGPNTSSSQSSASVVAATPTSTDFPGSTAAPGTAASSSTSSTIAANTTPRFTIADLPTTSNCTLDAPTADGQITFVVADRLYGLAADGAVECLANLNGRSPTWLSWSPDGDEVLVGPDLLLRANGATSSTGYFTDNTDVRWSAPTGKALIAPKDATGQLIWRNAHNNADRIDVSFADNITSATYHPAGKHIAVAGIGRDGQGPGVFVASNRGANAQRIGQLEPGTTATAVAFDMSGTSLVFVHQHADGSSHLHRYYFASNQLDTLADLPDVTPTDLTVSPVDEGDVAWTQSYSTVNSSARVLVGDSREPLMVNSPEGDHLSAPIGWLPGHRLLVKSMFGSASASAGPFELWEWSPSGMNLIIKDVTAAAARTMHGAYSELTIIPGSGFG